MTIQRTLSIIKPDATKRDVTGKINQMLESSGLRIIAQKRIKLSQEQAEGFYSVHKDRPFYNDLVNFMISGQVVVQVLEGENAFKDVSSIMMPTCANVSFKLNSIQNPIEMYEQDIYTIPANLAGLPAISIPSGKINNLPLGIQFVGNYLEEGNILNLSNKFQQNTNFHNE